MSFHVSNIIGSNPPSPLYSLNFCYLIEIVENVVAEKIQITT